MNSIQERGYLKARLKILIEQWTKYPEIMTDADCEWTEWDDGYETACMNHAEQLQSVLDTIDKMNWEDKL